MLDAPRTPPARGVGPVLTSGETADAVVEAICAENAHAHIVRHPGYVRVLVPERCAVSASAIERALGRPFNLPRDLEPIMPSFKGRLRIEPTRAVWEAGSR